MNYVNDLINSDQKPANIMVTGANLSKAQTRTDRLVLRDNTIQGFQIKDGKPFHQIDQLDEARLDEMFDLIDRQGFLTKEDHIVVDIDKMMKNLPELGNFDLIELKDEQPKFTVDITQYLTNTIMEKTSVEQSISAVDLNGDSIDDIFLFTDRDDTNVTGTLFLSR